MNPTTLEKPTTNRDQLEEQLVTLLNAKYETDVRTFLHFALFQTNDFVQWLCWEQR